MQRRRVVVGLLGTAVAGLAGCHSAARSDDDDRSPAPTTGPPPATDSSTPTPTSTTAEVGGLARHGQPSDICSTAPIDDFHIKAIVDPAFAPSWAAVDIRSRYTKPDSAGSRSADAAVVGLTAGDRARAYPVSVLWFHEVVNDTFGAPLLVTYCSICRTGLVAERRVRTEPTLFGVTGQLWHPPDRFISASAKAGRAFGAGRWNGTEGVGVREGPNLVMDDRLTGSFWSQAIGRAICGPMQGTRLSILPSTLTSWGEWRTAHPATTVLLPPPHSAVEE